MKKIIFSFLVATAHQTWAQSKTDLPTIAPDKFAQELNLAAEKTVFGNGFSVLVPQGWSYINSDFTSRPMETKIDDIVTKVSTAEVLMTPNSDISQSEVYFSVRDFVPKGTDITKLYKIKNKKEGAKLTASKWNGREWKILEYKSTYTDLTKKSKTTYSWYATTQLKDRDLTISASAPTPKKRDRYRAQFELTMKTVKVVE